MPSCVPSLPPLVTVILLLVYDRMCPSVVSSNTDVILPSFSWDPRNECFNPPNSKKNLKKGYAHMKVDQESRIYFICPSIAITYDVQTKYTPRKNMYENMFMVTKDDFNGCRLNYTSSRLVMKCDDPVDTQKLKYKRFNFAKVRSRQKDYRFEAGLTYYFIATSNGSQDSLGNRANGRCVTDNMKLAITICEHGRNCHLENGRCNEDDAKSKDGQLPRQLPQPLPATTIQPNINEKELPISLTFDASNVSDTRVVAQHSRRSEGSSLDKRNILYITLAAIGGLFVGILLTAGVWTIKRASRKKNTNRYSGAPSTATESVPVDEADEQREEDTNSGSVKIEVMNQKYFTSVDYRNSNEFHRLISTASTCSSQRHSDGERHCVTPVGGYK